MTACAISWQSQDFLVLMQTNPQRVNHCTVVNQLYQHCNIESFQAAPSPRDVHCPGECELERGLAEELCLLAGEVPLSLCVAAQLSEECRDCVD